MKVKLCDHKPFNKLIPKIAARLDICIPSSVKTWGHTACEILLIVINLPTKI